ncbi:Lsr2 dimerization domain-containing protein [Tessaracoccus aquimaris]|uniref:Lsr2 family DNA-binding protein n=1 Tax=Tessaracoccus aquimaris TaxID=1332264 RepID=UPI001873A95D
MRSPRGGRRGTSARAAKGGTSEIRAWAKDNGFEVSDRGRIPAGVLEAYEAAN